jgi:hypothetical protein
VTDQSGRSATKVMSIRVFGPPGIRTAVLANGVIGVAYSVALEANEGLAPYRWTMAQGILPVGLALDSAKGKISGTPSRLGELGFTLRLQDREGRRVDRSYSISVKPSFSVSTRSLLNAIVGVAYRQPLIATGGTGPYRWSVTAGSLSPGLAILEGSSEITGTPSQGGVFTVQIQAEDSLRQATAEVFSIAAVEPVRLTTEGFPKAVIGKPYRLSLIANGGSPPYTWFDAQGFPPGLTIDSVGLVSGSPTAIGTYRCYVVVGDTGVNSSGDTGIYGTECCGGRMVVVNSSIVVDEPLHIKTAALPSGITEAPYGAAIETNGGGDPTGLKWSIRSGTLPDGVHLTSGPRRGPQREAVRIEGPPARSGHFDFVVQVNSETGDTDFKAFSIVVIDPIRIVTSSLTGGLVAESYSETLRASGGVPPYVWSIGPLPTGLSLDPTTGAIHGTPRSSGSFSITVHLSDSGGHASSTVLNLLIRSD